MPDAVRVDFASPFNQPVLTYLGVTEPGQATVYLPTEVNLMALNTHPDIIEYFWGLAKESHPECACVINKRSRPLMAHPTNGIIFGLAVGTGLIAFRLPEPDRILMLAVPGYGKQYKFADSTVYASQMGEDWALLKPFDKRNKEMCQKAFDFTGTLT